MVLGGLSLPQMLCQCCRAGLTSPAFSPGPRTQVELRARRLLSELDRSDRTTRGTDDDIDTRAREDAEKMLMVFVVRTSQRARGV